MRWLFEVREELYQYFCRLYLQPQEQKHVFRSHRGFGAAHLLVFGKVSMTSDIARIYKEKEDFIFFEATVKSNLGIAKVYDVFMINKQQKITHHFAGIK